MTHAKTLPLVAIAVFQIAPYSNDIDPELGGTHHDYVMCVHECELEGCYKLNNWFLNKLVDYKGFNQKRCISQCTDQFRHTTTRRCPLTTTINLIVPHSYDVDPKLGAVDPDFVACVHECKMEGCYNLYNWFLNKLVDYKALNQKRCIIQCTDEFRHSTTHRCSLTTTSEEPTTITEELTTTTTEELTTNTTTTKESTTITTTAEPTITS